jgi:molybdopterin molybdotransferase
MRSDTGTVARVADLVTIAEALDTVLARAPSLEPELVRLGDAQGRVLARAAIAATDLPPFASSAMDGYAVRAADTPGRLSIVGSSAAGRPATTPLAPGQAIAISTGGVVPEQADAVVPVELVVEHDNSVEIGADVRAGSHIRPRGGDIRRGDEVVPAGIRLGPVHVGALAAAGVAELSCGRRPRVLVVTTGSELRAPGLPLGPGEIYESNGAMVAALLAAAGAVVEVLPPVADDLDGHRTALSEGLTGDVLVTSGGVSVGPHDLVRRIEQELGVEEVFWGVAMRPGKPLSFGVRDATLVFGLPGNPVSSLVATLLFVRPAVLALQGASDPGPPWLYGTVAVDVPRAAVRDDLLRARSVSSDAGTVLAPVTGQESHMITRAATADALVHVPRGEGTLSAGSPVRYLRLD